MTTGKTIALTGGTFVGKVMSLLFNMLSIVHKTKIMASGQSVSWQTEGEKEETVTEISFLGSKITAKSEYSHKI